MLHFGNEYTVSVMVLKTSAPVCHIGHSEGKRYMDSVVYTAAMGLTAFKFSEVV